MDVIGERPRGGRRMDKHREADVWIDLGVKLGGLVALFGGMAGACMMILSSSPHP